MLVFVRSDIKFSFLKRVTHDAAISGMQRAERKRLLYVALTRARDHLILSGTLPEEVQPSEFAKTRIEWVWNGLGVTPEDLAAGVCDAGEVLVRLISDPLAIPAEYGEVKRERVEVPAVCSGGTGTFVQPVPLVPDEGRGIPISELEGPGSCAGGFEIFTGR
jgi:ATP-dependent helicase/nuclease subunit A